MAQRNISKQTVLQKKYNKILDTYIIPVTENVLQKVTSVQIKITPISFNSKILIRVGVTGGLTPTIATSKFGLYKDNEPLGSFKDRYDYILSGQKHSGALIGGFQGSALQDFGGGYIFNIDYEYLDIVSSQKEITYSLFINTNYTGNINSFLYINRDTYRIGPSGYSYIEATEIQM